MHSIGQTITKLCPKLTWAVTQRCTAAADDAESHCKAVRPCLDFEVDNGRGNV